MTWVAYVDESMHAGSPTCPPTYILAAAILETADAEAVRERLAPLAPGRRRRFHWREAEDRERRLAVALVATLPSVHVVVVGAPMDPSRQERGRRLSLARLLFELDAAGITHVWLEARSPSQNQRERRTVDALRAQGVFGAVLKVDHRFPGGPDGDCLLWLPDIVAGAVRLAMDGEVRLRSRIDHLLTTVEIKLD